MNEFGNCLRTYRRNGTDTERGGLLTQERLGEWIGRYLNDLGVTGAAISNWENGRSSPSQNDRRVLAALIKALHQGGGLRSLAEANRLLAAGNYLALLPDEIREVDEAWLAEMAAAALAPSVDPDPISDQLWQRLRLYLPNELYEQVGPQRAREGDEDFAGAVPAEGATRFAVNRRCLEHLKKLLRIVATYAPHHLALSLLENPQLPEGRKNGAFLTGTLLFADISGFTDLSERLRKVGGNIGAEEVARIINDYLDVMLGILYRYGGQLVKFGGDAMLCLFTGEDQAAMRAIWAAWAMKVEMVSRFAEVEALHEVFPLNMKVGHSSGLLFAATVGSETHMEYILTGSAVERTARAESAANRGEVIVSAETYQEIQGQVEAEALLETPNYYRITAVSPETETVVVGHWGKIEAWLSNPDLDVQDVVKGLDALAPYLPVGLLPQLVYDPQPDHLTGQHRQVTALFANFVGMSEVINAYGPGNAAAITDVLQNYFELMQDEVDYYGGVANKVDLYDQGDKLMVIFGAPTAHERDARRAALTALAMQQAMTRLSDPLAAVILKQRIGIHTGFVFAGNVGSTTHHRREYTVMGDTVNLAARLMSAAPAGNIWASEDLWRQIAPDFTAEALPAISPRGISNPVAVYRLLAARGTMADRRPLQGLESPLVGRESELNSLVRCADDLLFGEGKKIVSITGEGGVGKTRLVVEWQKRVEAEVDAGKRIRWVRGYGRSYGQRTHGVFIDVLEHLANLEEADTPAERWNKLGQLLRGSLEGKSPDWANQYHNQLAYLGQFLGFDLGLRPGLAERIAGLGGEALQLQTRLALAGLLDEAGRSRPLILLLEDLHWADEASLELLRFLVDKIGDRVPLLFCLIYRAQKDRRIWQTWQALDHDYAYCQQIRLKELTGDEGQHLLMGLLQSSRAPDSALIRLVVEETDGNPLYMEEVLQRLMAEDFLVEEGGVWGLVRPVTRAAVPNSLYQVIQSRIDDLDFSSPGARRVLWLAAVLGTTFTEDALRYLFERTGRSADEFRRHLNELRNAGLLTPARVRESDRQQPGLKFKHGLVQQVAYENMSIAYRRQFHGEVAGWLEATYAENLRPCYGVLAWHYDHAEAWEKAFYYYWQAGKQDASAYANTRARANLERALQIAREAAPSPAALGEVYFELGKALVMLGDYERGLENLHFGYDVPGQSTEASSTAMRARVSYEIGRCYELHLGQLDKAWEWRERGMALLGDLPSSEMAMLTALGSIVRLRQGRLAEADHEAARTLEAASAANTPAALSLAHRLLSISLRSQGKLAEAMAHCRRGLALCEQTGDVLGQIKDITNLGILAFEMDDWPGAGDAYRKAISLLEKVGDAYQLGVVHTNLADLYYHLGDLGQCEQHAQQALHLAQKMEATQQIITVKVILGIVAWRRAEPEQALSLLAEAGKLAETAEMFQPTVDRWQAQVYLTQHDIPRAQAMLEKWLGGEAEVLADEAEPIQMLHGQVLAAQGETDQAVEVLRGSIERLEEAGMRYQSAQARLALAQVLAERDSGAARSLAEDAQAIFASLSARLDEVEAAALLAAG